MVRASQPLFQDTLQGGQGGSKCAIAVRTLLAPRMARWGLDYSLEMRVASGLLQAKAHRSASETATCEALLRRWGEPATQHDCSAWTESTQPLWLRNQRGSWGALACGTERLRYVSGVRVPWTYHHKLNAPCVTMTLWKGTLSADLERKLLRCVQLFATPWTVALQGPLSMRVLQARILEWVTVPVSRGSSHPRGRTQVSHITGRFFTVWATREAHLLTQFKPRTPPPPFHPVFSCFFLDPSHHHHPSEGHLDTQFKNFFSVIDSSWLSWSNQNYLLPLPARNIPLPGQDQEVFVWLVEETWVWLLCPRDSPGKDTRVGCHAFPVEPWGL